jgi:hypothetical protein
MLTSRSRRHEGGLRHRSLDFQEAAAFARYTTLQDGSQGMFSFPYCTVRLLQRHTRTHPFPVRTTALPFSQDTGEAGSGERTCNRVGTLHATNALRFVPHKDNTSRPCSPFLAFCTSLTLFSVTDSLAGQQCDHCWKRRKRVLDSFAARPRLERAQR